MKKISIFLMMLCFACFGGAKAQQTLTVCDGTEANQYIPFYAYSGDTQGTTSEFIIPESNLTQLNGKTITALKFYLSQSQSKTWTAVYKVYMTEVATTQLTRTIGPDAGTVVYQGTVDASGSEMTITFNQGNYTYNGGHLLIGTYVATSGAWDSYGKFYGIAATSAAYLSGDWNGNSTGAKDFIPKTTFSYLSDDPYITLTPASATVLTGFTETLTATYGNVSGTPTITYSSSNTSVATVSGSGTTATVTAVASGTATITASMTYQGTTYTATCAITVEDPSYCTPNPSSRDGKGITTLTFGSGDFVVNNSNSNGLPASSPYYGDYTSMVGGYEAGETATVTITYSTGTSTVYSYGTIIWVDWNKNYEFEDSEIVYTGTSAQGTGGTPQVLTATFTVPATQAADDYRMRIAGADSYFDSYIGGNTSANHSPCFSSTYAVCHDYTLRVTSASNCKKPTDLAATNVTKNSATLSWTENGEATAWNISVNGTVTPNVTNPYNLTGLTPATSYTVKVSPVCEDERWSDEITFPTLEACPTPSNLTATNVMPTSATLNWEGEAESYNVRYGMAGGEVTIFEDGFENGLDSWTTYTMGDAPAWRTTDPSEGLSWSGHNGSTNVAISMSWNNDSYTADNWLVTPQVQLGGTLKFYVYTNQSYPDDYEVKLSTSGNSISNFTVTLQELASIPTTGDWVEVNIDLSSYEGQNGYIAIHHSYYDGNYILVDDFGIYATQDAGEWINATSTTNSLDITGLTPEKDYVFQVQANCGSEDGLSEWSASATFTTPDACAVPIGLTAEVTGNAAELSWTGAQENYNVRYRKGFVYDFESAEPWTITDFSPCTVYDGDQAQCYGFNGETFTNIPFTGSTIAFQSQSGNLSSHSGNAFGMMVSALPSQYPDGITHSDDWFILPEITIANGDVFSFWGREITTQYGAETINVGIYGNTAGTFAATIAGNVAVNSTEWTEFSYDLSAYAGQTIKLAINYVSNDIFGFMFDDIFVGNPNWSNLIAVTGSTYTLENLDSQSTYLWQVQGVDCDGNGNNTDWSASATFTTPEFYTKTIQAVGAEAWAEEKGGYYLIASPLANNVAPTNVAGMITDEYGAEVTLEASTYDLYSFDQAETDEWRNYRTSNFNLVNGQGYLYASKEGTELVFTGAANSNNTQNVTLSLTAAADGLDFPAWNLVGNPFAKKAYISKSFYTLENSDTYTLNTAGTEILAMQGLLVIADYNNEPLNFTTVAPNSKVAKLNMNVSKDRSVVDQAIISFNEGQQLPKLQFRNGSTKVYMPMDGKEYAIVSAEAMGTMPVNFKAENNGSYTLSFTTEDVNFAYLHLIDNMTGEDVDLLAGASTGSATYTFDAKSTDFESRFKLVFATGNSNDDTFAFYSNGSFVINNEGNATLQVIDVNGRILKSESINGCANVNVNAAQGIYMLRLVNGNDVKVQKVVVR